MRFTLIIGAALALASCATTRPLPATEARSKVVAVARTTKAVAVDSSKAQTRETVTTEASTPGGFYALTFSGDSLEKNGSVAAFDAAGFGQMLSKDRRTGAITSRTWAPGGKVKQTVDRQQTQQNRQSGAYEVREVLRDSTGSERRDPGPVKQPRGPIHWLVNTWGIMADLGGVAMIVAAALGLVLLYQWLAGGWLASAFRWFIGLFRRAKSDAEK